MNKSSWSQLSKSPSRCHLRPQHIQPLNQGIHRSDGASGASSTQAGSDIITYHTNPERSRKDFPSDAGQIASPALVRLFDDGICRTRNDHAACSIALNVAPAGIQYTLSADVSQCPSNAANHIPRFYSKRAQPPTHMAGIQPVGRLWASSTCMITIASRREMKPAKPTMKEICGDMTCEMGVGE